MNQTTEFIVDMSCRGCSNAVKRIVERINKEAIGEVHANPSTSIVTVKHKEPVTSKQILDRLLMWSEASGKSVELNTKKRKTPSTTTTEEIKKEEERKAEKDLYSGGRRTRGKKRTRRRRKSRRKKRRKSRRKKRRR